MTLGARTVPDTSAPHLCLWNTAGFYALRDLERVQVDHHADGRLIGSFVAGRDGTELVSGYSAPFGGPDFVRDYETVANVTALVRTVVEQARTLGVERIRIRLKGPHYSEIESHLQFALLSTGFAIAAVDLNYYLDVRPFAAVEHYEHSLKPQSRRALRHALNLGVTTRLATDELDWKDGYYVLERNRVGKGRPMRLSYDYVLAARDAFGECVRLLVAEHDTTVVAAALLYRIAPGHDVVQYWGDAEHALAHSPMALLASAVVGHALDTGARFVDLGISTDHGVPNHGLIQFKRSIGARAETRLEVVGRVADLVES